MLESLIILHEILLEKLVFLLNFDLEEIHISLEFSSQIIAIFLIFETELFIQIHEFLEIPDNLINSPQKPYFLSYKKNLFTIVILAIFL